MYSHLVACASKWLSGCVIRFLVCWVVGCDYCVSTVFTSFCEYENARLLQPRCQKAAVLTHISVGCQLVMINGAHITKSALAFATIGAAAFPITLTFSLPPPMSTF